MILVLIVTLYLVVIDIKDEPGLEFVHKVWWFLFVLLTHVPGYLVFRGWLAVRRHRREEKPHAGYSRSPRTSWRRASLSASSSESRSSLPRSSPVTRSIRSSR